MSNAAPEGHQWTLYADMQITRRKRFHQVMNPQGQIVFRSKLISECFDFLDKNEVTRYLCLPDEERAPELRLFVEQEEEPLPWQN